MYGILLDTDDVKLDKILLLRVPPFCWDLMAYLFGLFILLNGNSTTLIISGIIFVSYGVLNIVFDTYTFSCEYTNDYFPKYDELGLYNWSIVNKKYNLKTDEDQGTQERIDLNDFLINKQMIDSSNLKLDLSFYIGNDEKLETLLNYIYLLGITKKNYTQINLNKLKMKMKMNTNTNTNTKIKMNNRQSEGVF